MLIIHTGTVTQTTEFRWLWNQIGLWRYDAGARRTVAHQAFSDTPEGLEPALQRIADTSVPDSP